MGVVAENVLALINQDQNGGDDERHKKRPSDDVSGESQLQPCLHCDDLKNWAILRRSKSYVT